MANLSKVLLGLSILSLAAGALGSVELALRPQPQVISYRGPGFKVSDNTRILIPEGWPGYVTVAAEELAGAIKNSAGIEPEIMSQKTIKPERADIVIGPYWVIRPEWNEPLPLAYVRPQPDEGYSIHIEERNLAVLGNSPRACFLGLQTLIQIAHQTEKTDAGFTFPGILISDWPAHEWRTLQLHLTHPGSPYDRGQHVYVPATSARVMERSIRLAAYSKLTGLVVDVESGMFYDRHPENFTTGISRNKKADIKKAVDLAKLLGLKLVPKSNSSSGHDGWVIPYAFAVPNTDIYIEEMQDLYDEIIETFRPSHFHVGLDEDTFPDLDSNPLRDTATHKKVLLADYEFFRRRGITILVWNDGIHQLRDEQEDVPRDVIVLPWMYGGWDFTGSQKEIDKGFRILCAPWSCWHVENDQFFSLYASSINNEKVLGMAGTFWYPVGKDDTDYRRCLVKAGDAFWNPLKAGDYPDRPEYYSPGYSGVSKLELTDFQPTPVPKVELPGLIELVTGVGEDHLEREAARERLVAAGTAVVPLLLERMAEKPEQISPWAEGTVRRIVREPFGEAVLMIEALEKAAGTTGPLRALALEMIAKSGNGEFLHNLTASEPAVSFAMGVSKDRRFLPALLEVAASKTPAQVNALLALGKLKGLDELLSLRDQWKSFDDAARENYARALVMVASEKTIRVLGELAEDAEWRVRFRAAVALGATQSPDAGPYILKLLDDDNPAVFRTALYWCTDTFILSPEEYFPELCARLNLDEDERIVAPIIHSCLLMWMPGVGQWLRGVEDPSRKIDYPSLSVWKEKYFIDAMNRMIGYKNAKHATYSMVLLIKSGNELDPDTILSAVKKFKIEDLRWFCERMREEMRPELVPVMKELWKYDDHLIRNFILQYCSRIGTPETFDIAYNGLKDIPEKDELLRGVAVYTMAAHLARDPEPQNIESMIRKAIPLMLDLYDQTTWTGGLESLDKALFRVSGKKPPKRPDNTPEGIEKRRAEWRRWWVTAHQTKLREP